MSAAHRKKSSWPMVLLVVVLGVAGWGAVQLAGGDEDAGRAIAGATVQRGPLKISVIERGNLEAADAVTLKSGVEGRTTVLWLVPEGTEVEAGDLLCELDASSLVDRRVSQEIRVQNAEAAYVKAKQNHAIQVSQNESDIANAEQQLEFAHIDLEQYLQGDMPQELQSLDESIMLTEEDLTRASQDLEWSKRLAAKGFLEQTALDADALAKTRAEVNLARARRDKELFERYRVPRRSKELRSDVTEMERELERVKLQATARLADFDANLRTTEATLQVERSELAKLESQIEKARLVAPVSGMVVYARENDGRWGGGEPMQEGSEVRERQDIITIPSSQGYVAKASLHESVLEKVRNGMTCSVTVDALHESFPGEVAFKAVLPDQNSWFANPDLRVYRTEIRLLAEDPRLRPGMSCSIEILVDTLRDVLQVPVQAVFLDAGRPVCFVTGVGGKLDVRPVTVGQNDGKWVEVQDGLVEGEVVLLARPPGIELSPATGEPGTVPGAVPERAPDGMPADVVPAAASLGDAGAERREGGERPEGGEHREGDVPSSGEARPEGMRRPGGGEGGRRGGPGAGAPGSGKP